jgi:excisionase family DNA binding protein
MTNQHISNDDRRNLHLRTQAGIAIDLRTDLRDLPAIMTETEVAAYLRLTTKKLRRMTYEKRGPRSRGQGSDRRFYRQDLIDWFAED